MTARRSAEATALASRMLASLSLALGLATGDAGAGPVSPAAGAAPGEAELAAAQQLARRIAADLKAACPLGDPASQGAFDRCRQALFGESSVKRALTSRVLWGRQARDPATALKDSRLTQFAPDIFVGLYLPVFMFDGTSQVQWVESEKLFRVKLGAAFRNRLPPGQFPYPFWHEPAKWDAYENANAVLLWLSPAASPQIRVAQFTWQDGPLAGVAVQRVATQKFDGRWLWTDATGRTQPAVTLFDGLYSADNPYKAQLEERYRPLAVALREGQCFECHVPSNPNGLKRLVLLQTPAHAAGEIGRILKSVRNDRMPVNETGIESPLPEAQKKALLELGAAFERAVDSAREWEQQAGQRSARAP